MATSVDDVERHLGKPPRWQRNGNMPDLSPSAVKELREWYPRNDRLENAGSLLSVAWAQLADDGKRAMGLTGVRDHATALSQELERLRKTHGTLALPGNRESVAIPGKVSTPGQLPAVNVAALGRSMFTDYLVPVLLAALLLLAGTIGAIAVAARKTEALK
jgi:hypothetical protein